MRVRVYDNESKNYFISEVYAIINSGYYKKYLVLEETDNNRYFKMFDYLDKSSSGSIYPVNINVISSNEPTDSWMYKTESYLQYFMRKLGVKDKYKGIYSFRGYSFVFDQKDLLITLFNGNKVPYEEILGDKEQVCTNLDGWNYVET